MMKELPFYLFTALFILNLIWVTEVKFKNLVSRRKPWQRELWILYFVLTPIAWVWVLLKLEAYCGPMLIMGLFGLWFAVSQYRHGLRNPVAPRIISPLAVFSFILNITITGFGFFHLLTHI